MLTALLRFLIPGKPSRGHDFNRAKNARHWRATPCRRPALPHRARIAHSSLFWFVILSVAKNPYAEQFVERCYLHSCHIFLDLHQEACNNYICPSGLFGGVLVLAEVRIQEGESLENALRRFKRKVQTEDIIKEVKRHSFYLKPGEKRRVKEALARKRSRKKARKEQD